MPTWFAVKNHLDSLAPGLICASVVAIAAMFMSEHYRASAMLFALLLGMALNFLGQEDKCVAGIQFAASTVLRIGVALLGLRITFGEISALGPNTALMVVAGVLLTILFGWLFSRFSSAEKHFGLLTGGAVANCGASAALSTIAMVVYPVIVGVMGFNPHRAGIFLGATIHDVAQVVGAGYSMGKDAGDTATIVKLLRVAMLLPVILVLSLMFRERAQGSPIAICPPLLHGLRSRSAYWSH